MDHTIHLLLTHEAAELARNSPRTIRRWMKQGRLKGYRSHPGRGGVLLFQREDVLACLGIVEGPHPSHPAGIQGSDMARRGHESVRP